MTRAWDDDKATLLSDDSDVDLLSSLRADPAVSFVDTLEMQRRSLREIVPAPDDDVLDEKPVWAYYPWRQRAVRVLGPRSFRTLRLDRNRHKITTAEQMQLSERTVGIVGLSVGHAVAVTLALEGLCGGLRLADFDTLELSNLNRVPSSVIDLGVNKAVAAARRIAEIDPYLPVTLWRDGLGYDSVAGFLDDLDIVVDECDSLDIKVALRLTARSNSIPVLMATSDRGLLDVERFDLEPDRPLFHGMIEGLDDIEALAGLSPREKIPIALRILGADQLSAPMLASLVEVDETVSTWPQLGGDVMTGAAQIAAAVRRIGLGHRLDSGRVHHDDALDAITTPSITHRPLAPADAVRTTNTIGTGVDAVVHAATRAPSGGNVQPWHITANAQRLEIRLDPTCTTAMDVRYRASYLAIGAALHNARIAAAASALLGPIKIEDHDHEHPVVTMKFGHGTDNALAARYGAMLDRTTNRSLGTPQPIAEDLVRLLTDTSAHEGARLTVLTDRDDLETAAHILAESDRIRFLTEHLHREMISELRWPPIDSVETGIDVRSLELDSADLAALDIAARPDVMERLRTWDLGRALGQSTRDRVVSSSALAVITVGGTQPTDFIRAGQAVESTWILAQSAGLSVQPMSPVFLYAQQLSELTDLSPHYATTLHTLQRDFTTLAGTEPDESFALILRLSHAPAPSVRSARRPNTCITTI